MVHLHRNNAYRSSSELQNADFFGTLCQEKSIVATLPDFHMLKPTYIRQFIVLCEKVKEAKESKNG
jgi:hypothetical protein